MPGHVLGVEYHVWSFFGVQHIGVAGLALPVIKIATDVVVVGSLSCDKCGRWCLECDLLGFTKMQHVFA